MPTAYTKFQFIAPEFSSVDEATFNTCLEVYEIPTSITHADFGDKYTLAIALIAAHYFKLRKDSTNGATANLPAEISSVKEMDLSVTRRSGAEKDTVSQWYASTTYGKQYLALRKKCVMPGVGFSLYG